MTRWRLVQVLLLLCLCLFLSSFFAMSSLAGEESENFTGSAEAGTGTVSFNLGYYHNSDSPGDGNPFLDEKLTVIEPVLLVDYNINERLAVWGQLAYDNVSSASIKRLSKFSNQSGASGDYYFGADLGLRYELTENQRMGGYINASIEYDYKSFGLGGHFAQDFANKNTTLKLSANGYIDTVDLIRFDGSDDGTDQRYSFATTLDWHQILTPRTVGDLGATFSYQNGFLETAFNAIVIEDPLAAPNPNLDNQARGLEALEDLPNTRIRGALFGRVRHLLMPGISAEMGGRLYADTWGIRSVSVEPALLHSFGSERFDVRLGYRFYTQSAADDFSKRFTLTSTARHRTQDSDLAAFDSHAVNIGLGWNWSPTLRFNLGGGYVFRSDNIDQLLLNFGVRMNFD